jgi:hypothetical protein
MARPMSEGVEIGCCDFLVEDARDCGAVAVLALSCRHVRGAPWQRFGACREHVDALRVDLAPIFELSPTYAFYDVAGRAVAEAKLEIEDVSSDAYERAAAVDPFFVPDHDDPGWLRDGEG